RQRWAVLFDRPEGQDRGVGSPPELIHFRPGQMRQVVCVLWLVTITHRCHAPLVPSAAGQPFSPRRPRPLRGRSRPTQQVPDILWPIEKPLFYLVLHQRGERPPVRIVDAVRKCIPEELLLRLQRGPPPYQPRGMRLAEGPPGQGLGPRKRIVEFPRQ